MKFGKLQNIEGVDFSLPPDHPITAESLSAAPPADARRLFIGCTGWSMKEWVGKIYPAGAKTKDFLGHYGRQFNTIELNTTHYRIPTQDTIRKWYEETPADFRFCPKAPQTVSHSRDLGVSQTALPQFADAVAGLQEKLGCCFLQLPPYFGADRLPVIERFVDHWPAGIPLALELRHESWFSGDSTPDALFALLHARGLGVVITDVAGRRDVLHMGLTTPVAMVRFVGNGLHPTDYERADRWTARLQSWFEAGLHNAFFFPHQPDNVHAPEMAQYICRSMEKNGILTRGPQFLNDREQPGNQMSLF